MSDEAKPTPQQPKPNELDPAADQLPATRENWPGRSEPGHIRRIGPARRVEDQHKGVGDRE